MDSTCGYVDMLRSSLLIFHTQKCVVVPTLRRYIIMCLWWRRFHPNSSSLFYKSRRHRKHKFHCLSSSSAIRLGHIPYRIFQMKKCVRHSIINLPAENTQIDLMKTKRRMAKGKHSTTRSFQSLMILWVLMSAVVLQMKYTNTNEIRSSQEGNE